MKYRNAPSISTIKGKSKHNANLYFNHRDKNTVPIEIKSLETNKAEKDIDIPVKTLKPCFNFFAQ